MFAFFKPQSTSQRVPKLPYLDAVLYPLIWQQQTFSSAQQVLHHLINNLSADTSNGYYRVADLSLYQQHFSEILQANEVYQDWINFTVFGRYVQRSFSAFYRQTEDVFNAEMPELLRYELMRHTQCLPLEQVLMVGGKIDALVRQEKLIITTLNPFKALSDAINKPLKHPLSKTPKTMQQSSQRTQEIIINFIRVNSEHVKAFAVKHNKYTQDSLRNEIMILDFNQLRLTQEDIYKNNTQPEVSYLIRYYSIA